MLTIKIKSDDGKESEVLTQQQLDIITTLLQEKIPKKKLNQTAIARLAAAGIPAIFTDNGNDISHKFNNALKPLVIKKPVKQSLKQKQALCDKWNVKYPIGTPVQFTLDSDDKVTYTTTSSLAEVLGGHTAVIWLDGVKGCYELDKVSPLIPVKTKKTLKK